MTPFAKFIIEKIGNQDWFEFRKGIIGAEVGVRDGLNAFYLIQGLPIKRLYLVDHFPVYDDCNNKLWTEDEQWINYKSLVRVVNSKDVFEKTMLIHYPSTKARDALQEISFDFVYIDGKHDYETVKDDMNWWNLIKKGGIIGGHDYDGPWGADVKKAVDEFAKNKSADLTILDTSRGGVEWAIVKNE